MDAEAMLSAIQACGTDHVHPSKVRLGWSCERPKGHEGMHRHINYVWESGDDRATYCPLPVRNRDGRIVQ